VYLLILRCTVCHSFSFCFGYRLFFFQAEDGIRYRNVTGVQTCALPISPPLRGPTLQGEVARVGHPAVRVFGVEPQALLARAGDEIGRASCRERVSVSVFDVCLKYKTIEDVPDTDFDCGR